jgi:hypothetical protein
MALDPLQIVDEVSRLANSASVTNSRRLDTNAHIVAALSLLSGGLGGGSSGGAISSGDVSAGINASTDIEAIKENLIAILAELVNSRGLDEQWVQDSSPTPIKMLRRVSVDQTTGAITVSYVDGSPAQTAVTPVLPVTPIGVSRAALTPVTYQLNNGATVFDGYLDELSTPTALYTDLLRQTQVTIGSAPTDALGTSIKAVDPGLKTSRLADVRDGIDASGDIGAIINALNAIKGSTDLIDVAGGINSSTDINAIIADLDTLAANSITPVSGRLPVAIADLPGTGITGESIGTGGAGLFGWLSSIAAYSRQILGRIPTLVSGRIPVDVEAGRAMAPATGWDMGLSDSQWQRRFYRLMFPGGLGRSTITTAAIGAYTLTGIAPGARIVITRVILQLQPNAPAVTILIRSIDTTSSTVGQFRLVVEGDLVCDALNPAQYIRLAPGANIGIDLSVASAVYAQFYWYLEDPTTGLPLA